MKTTMNFDAQLLSETPQVTGIGRKMPLVREGLHALIQRESARRLVQLGGPSHKYTAYPGDDWNWHNFGGYIARPLSFQRQRVCRAGHGLGFSVSYLQPLSPLCGLLATHQ